MTTDSHVALLFLALVAPAALQDNWLSTSFQDFIQKRNEDTAQFFETQRLEIEDSMNNIKEKFDETGRTFADTFSYLPEHNLERSADNPDVYLTVPAIISRHGYQCETHVVESQGYLLSLHRIPFARNGSLTPSRTILLQHGVFGSSDDWILNGPEKALAYVLADAGYDVWMANIRGNRYSRDHEQQLSTYSKAFWNFSWHDVAMYDVPAVIDYILGLKGAGTKIAYVGHSMGTTILFSMLTLRPEYNQVLTAGFALAPIVFLTHLKSPIKTLAPIASTVAYMEMAFGSHEFLPKNSLLGKLYGTCSVENNDISICKKVLFNICGANEKQLNETVLRSYLGHLGTGTSWKTIVHFAQEIISGKFQQFDYGTSDNRRVYGSDSPPEYDLRQVTLPIKLYWSRNDLLSSEEDVGLLRSRLPGAVDSYMVPDPQFNHLDYLWAIDAPALLNRDIIGSLDKVFNQDAEDSDVAKHSSRSNRFFKFHKFK